MVTKKNLRDIIKKLIEHVHTADGHYKDNLIEKIISICNQDSYHYVTDFEWYITVLMTLVRLIGPGTKHGTFAFVRDLSTPTRWRLTHNWIGLPLLRAHRQVDLVAVHGRHHPRERR